LLLVHEGLWIIIVNIIYHVAAGSHL
jgi:hypothetical protein